MLRKIWRQLDFVDGRDDIDLAEQNIERLGREVRDTNRLDLAYDVSEQTESSASIVLMHTRLEQPLHF